jgi:predicted DNA-binding mobile mystery protein A
MLDHKAIRNQLDHKMQDFRQVPPAPFGGWIRSIRTALGMTGRQFAARMEVEPSRVTMLEKNETSGNLTLRSLRRAAEALDCDLVYALVPRSSLEDAVRRQAYKVAARNMQQVSHSMRLEDQSLSVEDEENLLRERVEALMREEPKRIWESPEKRNQGDERAF